MPKQDQLIKALDYALANKWDEAHSLVQDSKDQIGYWIHAIIHRVEGDSSNARYWYRRAKKPFTNAEPIEELKSIQSILSNRE